LKISGGKMLNQNDNIPDNNVEDHPPAPPPIEGLAEELQETRLYLRALENIFIDNNNNAQHPSTIIRNAIENGLLTEGAVRHIFQTIAQNTDYTKACLAFNNLQTFLEKKGATTENASKITCIFNDTYRLYHNTEVQVGENPPVAARTLPLRNLQIDNENLFKKVFRTLINEQFPETAETKAQQEKHIKEIKNIAPPSRKWQQHANLTEEHKSKLKKQEQGKILSINDLNQYSLIRLAKLLDPDAHNEAQLRLLLKRENPTIYHNGRYTFDHLNRVLARSENAAWRHISFDNTQENIKKLERAIIPNTVARNFRELIKNMILADYEINQGNAGNIQQKTREFALRNKPAFFNDQECRAICDDVTQEYLLQHLADADARERYKNKSDQRAKNLSKNRIGKLHTEETVKSFAAWHSEQNKDDHNISFKQKYKNGLADLLRLGLIDNYDDYQENGNDCYKIWFKGSDKFNRPIVTKSEIIHGHQGTYIKTDFPQALNENNKYHAVCACLYTLTLGGTDVLDASDLDSKSQKTILACGHYLKQLGIKLKIYPPITGAGPQFSKVLKALRETNNQKAATPNPREFTPSRQDGQDGQRQRHNIDPVSL